MVDVTNATAFAKADSIDRGKGAIFPKSVDFLRSSTLSCMSLWNSHAVIEFMP